MEEKPEALRLAEWAEWFCKNVNDPQDFRWVHMTNAATELRRLHEVNQELLEALKLADALLWGANMNAVVVERKVKAAIAKGEQA